MKPSLSIFAIPCILVFALLATGCSTPQTRAQECAGSFDKLPQSQKDTALKKSIAVGMTQDAVYVALGKPSHVAHLHVKNVVQECWTYVEMETEMIPNWQTIPITTSNGRIMSATHYVPIQIQIPRGALDVVFENGRVVSFGKPKQ